MHPFDDKPVQGDSAPQFEPTRAYAPDDSAAALAALLDQYLADLQAGKQPDRQKLLDEHPELAPELEQCLSGLEFIQRASKPDRTTPAQLGDFRLVREIGRGGMGVVYEAEQISLKRQVALKVLRIGGVTDAEAMQRFQREAETVAGLHHTNIVPIFAVGCEGGVNYYAMQFIEGRSLAEVATEREASQGGEAEATIQSSADKKLAPLEPRDVAHWGLQAAEALSHAHQRGVIHRDIKPSNLILDQEGRIWLTDFGLARREHDVTLSLAGALLGTPRYMSPEQASAATKPLDHRTDIYSLGATLYELATGKPIFDADSPHGVITQILSAEPPAPSTVAPNLPRDLETIIVKCLAKEPVQRYATAQDLADDLRAFLEDRPIQARRPTLIERSARWFQKHRRAAAAAAISASIAVAIMVGAIVGTRFYRESRLGHVQFSTDGPQLVAEIVDREGQPVVGSLPVPTSEPVAVPEGEYQVRLSSSGLLSETWPLDVTRGGTHGGRVGLGQRWLWPPQDLPADEQPEVEVVEFPASGDRAPDADLIVVRLRVRRPDGSTAQAINRIDGATGEPAWPRELVFDAESLPEGRNLQEWSSLLGSSYRWSGQDSQHLQPVPDLNGDGFGDLVLLARGRPALAAVSGQDGSLLWWFRAYFGLPKGVDETKVRVTATGGGAVVGRPVVADVDSDGVSDVIAVFVSHGESVVTPDGKTVEAKGGEGWVVAVSGGAGAPLWRYRLPTGWRDGTNLDHHRMCRPQVVQLGDRRAVVLVAGKTLLALDVKTGAEAFPPHDLGEYPIDAPSLADLDGDGGTDALLQFVRTERDESSSSGESSRLALRAVSLTTRQALWEKGYRPAFDFNQLATQAPRRLVGDLNGDGRAEIVVSVGYHWDRMWPSDRGSGLELLDGATGQSLWQRRLWVGYYQQEPIERFITGPDLDGDGAAELFAVWTSLAEQKLMAAAHSGKDGSTLWRRELSGYPRTSGRSSPLQWWQPGPDGWPLLALPVANAQGGQHMTFFLSAGSGELVHTLPEVHDPQIADFNADGVLDLFYTVAPQGAPRMLALRGAPPEPWRRLGEWEPAGDFDGDGYTDLLERGGNTIYGPDGNMQALVARSGHDGRVLWRYSIPRIPRDRFSPLSREDLNGDGIADLVIVEERSKPVEGGYNNYETLAALSGHDGQRLWTAEDFGLRDGMQSNTGGTWGDFHYPFLERSEDLNGDGAADVLAAYHQNSQLWLASLSGRDGRLLWKVPFNAGAFVPRRFSSDSLFSDLNGDAAPDVVLWSGGVDDQRRQLQAFSGRDGQSLWIFSATSQQSMSGPPPVCGDLDGDGHPEVVALVERGYDQQSGKYRREVIALDGKDGSQQWAWSWQTGNATELTPLVVDFDGNGRGSVCVGLKEEGSPQIVILSGAGEVRERIPLKLPAGSLGGFGPARSWWGSADVDGDGRGELLYASDGQLWASRGGEREPLWKWRLPEFTEQPHYQSDAGTIVDIQPGAAGGPATIVAWAGREVYGLSGSTGAPQWKCDIPWSHGTGFSDPPTVKLLSAAEPAGLPRVICHWRSYVSDIGSTIVRQAWPVASDGTYEPPLPAPRTYEAIPDPTLPGPTLPWIEGDTVWDKLLSAAFACGVGVLLPYVVPAWLAVLTIRRRSWAFGILLLAYAAIALFTPWPIGIPALVALIVPAVFGFQAVKERSLKLGLVAIGFLLLLVAPFLVFRELSTDPLRHTHSGDWWWLHETVGDPFLPLLLGMPGLVFWWLVIRSWRDGDWTKLRRLLASSVVLSVVAAAVALWLWSLGHHRGVTLSEYRWDGWYVIWFWGGWLTGLVMLLYFGGRRVRLWWSHRVQRGLPARSPA